MAHDPAGRAWLRRRGAGRACDPGRPRSGRAGGHVLLPEQRLPDGTVLANDHRGAREQGGFTGPAPFLAANDVLYAYANVSYRSGVRLSSRLVTRPAAELAGVKPTLERQALVDAMDTSRDWSWVPAHTDPCREDRFFAGWDGPAGERGSTLDPETFPRPGRWPSTSAPARWATRSLAGPAGRPCCSTTSRHILRTRSRFACRTGSRGRTRPSSRPCSRPRSGMVHGGPGGWSRASSATPLAPPPRLGPRRTIRAGRDEPAGPPSRVQAAPMG